MLSAHMCMCVCSPALRWAALYSNWWFGRYLNSPVLSHKASPGPEGPGKPSGGGGAGGTPAAATHSCTGMSQVISTCGLRWIGENHKKEWNKIHNLRQDKKNLNKNVLCWFWQLPSPLVGIVCKPALPRAEIPAPPKRYIFFNNSLEVITAYILGRCKHNHSFKPRILNHYN